jgi:hypothetical protein
VAFPALLFCVQFENVQYAPAMDAIKTVFGTYGMLEKVIISEQQGGWQVRSIKNPTQEVNAQDPAMNPAPAMHPVHSPFSHPCFNAVQR